MSSALIASIVPLVRSYGLPRGWTPRVAELILGVLSKAGQDGLRSLHAAREAHEKRMRSRKRRAQRS